MMNKNIDKRFALIAENGDLLYPYKKNQKETGRFGFALTAPGEQDRHGKGHYTEDITEVVKRLVFDRWNVRVKTINAENKREGSMGIGKNAIKGYWISEDLKHLVLNSTLKPTDLPNQNGQKNQDYHSSFEGKESKKLVDSEVIESDSSDGLEESIVSDLNRTVEILLSESSNLSGEDVDVIAKRRVGQGPFRRLLEKKYGVKCFLSGITNRELLIASHIVPWSKSDAKDKVNPGNALLLSVSWDSVFDKGLVTFGENGDVVFSPELDDFSAKILGISRDARIPEQMMNDERRSYLKYHRENIFRGVDRSLT